MHIDNIISKASKRLHLITQLKKAQVKDLIQIYCACIHSTLEYASPCFPLLPTAVPEFRYRKDPKTVPKKDIS
jgi:hypothetical protein